ncbi:LPS assembly lipoprotein LptE [Caldimonas brevitalea]|uniref:LPS-assembly lipoprotein LptE n=1 Tax=Caldimonas brevitalea TaxID=413882 RepID=A0A0G3BHZ0_9BURK|nr:LPS assembly lipoprotein LptE [Caldimonas brevitalea]AKJ26971.1 LPS-assembly lipoprotein [Caldimonas brevitalea]
MAARLSRRLWLSAVAAPLLLSACGFQLRGAPSFAFRSIQLGFSPRSELGIEVRRQLVAAPDMRVVEASKDAEVVLEVFEDSSDRYVTGKTSTGQVREIAVRARLRFRLRTPDGRELIPETLIQPNLVLSYNESAALAKESEEAEVLREMRQDITQQLMRRLAAAKL